MDETEFRTFVDILKEKLPITFRVNPIYHEHQAVVKIFSENEGKAFFDRFLKGEEVKLDDGDGELGLKQKPYYPPGNLLYELSMPRQILRKNTSSERSTSVYF